MIDDDYTAINIVFEACASKSPEHDKLIMIWEIPDGDFGKKSIHGWCGPDYNLLQTELRMGLRDIARRKNVL